MSRDVAEPMGCDRLGRWRTRRRAESRGREVRADECCHLGRMWKPRERRACGRRTGKCLRGAHAERSEDLSLDATRAGPKRRRGHAQRIS
eukprot:2955702-Prymnesium_polylepis.1